jgi:beta-phosphoglucomutase-like phosphatase (HAD superfamily)
VEDSQAGIQAIVDARMFVVEIGTNLRGAHWLFKETAALTPEGPGTELRADLSG